MASTTEDELKAGRARVEMHERRLAEARKAEAKRREEEFKKAPGNVDGVDPEPMILKPFVAPTEPGFEPTPTFTTLNETDEEREARMAAILEREKAVMDRRLGAEADPDFNPDADAERKAREDREQAAKQAADDAKAKETAAVKSRIKATSALDSKGADEGTKAQAKEAKAKEGQEKAGEPGTDGDVDPIDALLNE